MSREYIEVVVVSRDGRWVIAADDTARRSSLRAKLKLFFFISKFIVL